MNLYFDPHNYLEDSFLPLPPTTTSLAANTFFSVTEQLNARMAKIEERLAKLEGEI